MAKKKVSKKEFGLGVRALLGGNTNTPPPQKEEVVKQLSNTIASIPVEQITPYRRQPRTEFAIDALKELSESIKVHGLIQPVTVRHMGGDEYQLISGERRLRASKLAGLAEIPAYIRIANDQEMLEMALIENIQREALNPMEIALTYSRLLEEFDLTHDKLADRVGKKRTTITNFLSILKLPPTIQNGLKEGKISVGHAKAINGLQHLHLQKEVYHKILTEGLSVRATEAHIAALKKPANSKKASNSNNLPTEYEHIQRNLRKYLGSKVQLKLKDEQKGNGSIVINFTDTEELNRILDLLED